MIIGIIFMLLLVTTAFSGWIRQDPDYREACSSPAVSNNNSKGPEYSCSKRLSLGERYQEGRLTFSGRKPCEKALPLQYL